MKAICIRCGAFKPRALAPCPDCGHRPEGGDRPLSYLLSSHHLSEPELERAADRLRAGEAVAPSPELLEIARTELTATQTPQDDGDSDPGLSREERFLLLLGDLLLSPLIGLVAWWGWRAERPAASRQALRITAPIALLLSALWIRLVFF